MKKVLVLFILIISSVVLILSACQKQEEAEPQVIVVATVNGVQIFEEDYNKKQKLLKNVYMAKLGKDIWTQSIGNKTVKDIVSEELLEIMIQEILIEDYMKKSGYEPDEAEIQRSYDEFKKAMQDDENIQKLYEGMENDEEFIRNQIKTQLYEQAFEEKIRESVKADTQMLENAYKNDIVLVSAGHILLTDEEKANEVAQKLKDGDDFAQLAIEYSQDPGSAMNGGSLGFVQKGKMPPAFEEKAFKMQKGEISEPIKTQRGYHIILLEDTQTVADLEEYGVSDEEVNFHKEGIIDEKSLLAVENKINELKENSTIEKFSEAFTQQ